MSPSDASKDVVRAYFERALSGDPRLPELLADEVSWWIPPGSPMGGTYRGRDAVLAMLERALALYDLPTLKLDVELLVAEGRHVCALFRLESRTARGTQHASDYVAVFEVDGGKIHSVREFLDTQRIREVVFGATA